MKNFPYQGNCPKINQWPRGGTYICMNGRKISPFYRTLSPIGAAALPAPMKTKEKVEQGKGTADHLLPLGDCFFLALQQHHNYKPCKGLRPVDEEIWGWELRLSGFQKISSHLHRHKTNFIITLSFFLSVVGSVCLFVRPFVLPSVCLSVCPSVRCVHPFVCYL